MAVKVVAKQVMCPKCFETLEYTTQDVIKKESTERYTLCTEKYGKTVYIPTVGIYDLWYIKCPTCGNLINVNKVCKATHEL